MAVLVAAVLFLAAHQPGITWQTCSPPEQAYYQHCGWLHAMNEYIFVKLGTNNWEILVTR